MKLLQKSNFFFLLFHVTLLTSLIFSSQQYCNAQTGISEKILFNGKIFTANVNQPYVEAVAVKEDKIIATGNLVEMKTLLSDNATLIDLKGKCLLPGLIDSHVHALSGGENLLAAALNDVLITKEELRVFAANTLQSKKGMRGDVLYIRGMHSGTWAASNDLDDLFNKAPYLNQPVVLRGSDGHTAWVNRVMLRRAKIDRDFILSLSDTDRKYFGFDAEMNPNGLISEEGFQKINAAMPVSTVDPVMAGELGINHLNSLGITAWLDPSTGDISEGENNGRLRVYQQLAQINKLKAHVVGTVVADGDGSIEDQIKTLRKLQKKFSGVKDLEIIGFKFLQMVYWSIRHRPGRFPFRIKIQDH